MLQQKDAFAAADAALKADASAKVLLHRIVQHFQRLFDVSKLQGMFPKMNVRCTLARSCECVCVFRYMLFTRPLLWHVPGDLPIC